MDNDGALQMLRQWQRRVQAAALRFGPKDEVPFDPLDPKKRKLMPHQVAETPILPIPALHSYLLQFRAVFPRRDSLHNAELYVLGLCSNLLRKNGETMEAALPTAKQQNIYHFLARSRWLAPWLDRLRVQYYAKERELTTDPLHVIVDEVSLPKQGQDSVGVARQYLGCLGKVANGQVAVSLHGVWGNDDIPITGELYLPEAWATDPKRRSDANVPAELSFRTKPEIALSLVERVQPWLQPIAMVHADAGYGTIELMISLDNKDLQYCIAVRKKFTVALGDTAGPFRVETVEAVREALQPNLWKQVAYRRDVDGTLLTREFAAIRVCPRTKEQHSVPAWLLLERPVNRASNDYKYYIVTAPETTTVEELARLAHIRPRIERDSYENAKQEVGLADYQGRSWPGFHHHLALVWLALTWFARQRRPLSPGPGSLSPPPMPPDNVVDLPVADEPAPEIPQQSEPAKPDIVGPDLCGSEQDARGEVEVPTSDPPGQINLALGNCNTRCTEPLPSVVIAFARGMPVSPICAASETTIPKSLPHQAWESIQAVHRRFVEWCRITVVEELRLLGRRLVLPSLASYVPNPYTARC